MDELELAPWEQEPASPNTQQTPAQLEPAPWEQNTPTAPSTPDSFVEPLPDGGHKLSKFGVEYFTQHPEQEEMIASFDLPSRTNMAKTGLKIDDQATRVALYDAINGRKKELSAMAAEPTALTPEQAKAKYQRVYDGRRAPLGSVKDRLEYDGRQLSNQINQYAVIAAERIASSDKPDEVLNEEMRNFESMKNVNHDKIRDTIIDMSHKLKPIATAKLEGKNASWAYQSGKDEEFVAAYQKAESAGQGDAFMAGVAENLQSQAEPKQERSTIGKLAERMGEGVTGFASNIGRGYVNMLKSEIMLPTLLIDKLKGKMTLDDVNKLSSAQLAAAMMKDKQSDSMIGVKAQDFDKLLADAQKSGDLTAASKLKIAKGLADPKGAIAKAKQIEQGVAMESSSLDNADTSTWGGFAKNVAFEAAGMAPTGVLMGALSKLPYSAPLFMLEAKQQVADSREAEGKPKSQVAEILGGATIGTMNWILGKSFVNEGMTAKIADTVNKAMSPGMANSLVKHLTEAELNTFYMGVSDVMLKQFTDPKLGRLPEDAVSFLRESGATALLVSGAMQSGFSASRMLKASYEKAKAKTQKTPAEQQIVDAVEAADGDFEKAVDNVTESMMSYSSEGAEHVFTGDINAKTPNEARLETAREVEIKRLRSLGVDESVIADTMEGWTPKDAYGRDKVSPDSKPKEPATSTAPEEGIELEQQSPEYIASVNARKEAEAAVYERARKAEVKRLQDMGVDDYAIEDAMEGWKPKTFTDASEPIAKGEREAAAKSADPELKDLLDSVDGGGVPSFFTNNLKRIMGKYGVDTNGKTPNDAIYELREKIAQPKETQSGGIRIDEKQIQDTGFTEEQGAGKSIEPMQRETPEQPNNAKAPATQEISIVEAIGSMRDHPNKDVAHLTQRIAANPSAEITAKDLHWSQSRFENTIAEMSKEIIAKHPELQLEGKEAMDIPGILDMLRQESGKGKESSGFIRNIAKDMPVAKDFIIVDNISQLPTAEAISTVMFAKKFGKTPRAVHSPISGKTYIISNLFDNATVGEMKTELGRLVRHEFETHYGVENLFKDDATRIAEMNGLHEKMSSNEEWTKDWNKKAESYKKYDPETPEGRAAITEELLASISEHEPTWLGDVVKWVKEQLENLGIHDFDDKAIREMLKRTKAAAYKGMEEAKSKTKPGQTVEKMLEQHGVDKPVLDSIASRFKNESVRNDTMSRRAMDDELSRFGLSVQQLEDEMRVKASLAGNYTRKTTAKFPDGEYSRRLAEIQKETPAGRKLNETARRVMLDANTTAESFNKMVKDYENFNEPTSIKDIASRHENEFYDDLPRYKDNSPESVLARISILNNLTRAGDSRASEALKSLTPDSHVFGLGLRMMQMIKATPEMKVALLKAGLEKQGLKLRPETERDLRTRTQRVEDIQSLIQEERAKQAGKWDKEGRDKLKTLHEELGDAIRELAKLEHNINGREWWKIYVAALQGAVLTPKSQGVNVVSNLSMMLVRGGDQAVAAIVDAMRSAATGEQRLVSSPLGKMSKGARERWYAKVKQGFKEAWTPSGDSSNRPIDSIIQAFYGTDLAVGLDGKVRKIDRFYRVMEATTSLLSEYNLRLLGLGDVIPREFIKSKWLDDEGQRRGLKGDDLRNFIENPPAEVERVAEYESRYTVFQDPTIMGDMIDRIGNAIKNADYGKNGIPAPMADFMMGMSNIMFRLNGGLFLKTPTNMASKGLAYGSATAMALATSLHFPAIPVLRMAFNANQVRSLYKQLASTKEAGNRAGIREQLNDQIRRFEMNAGLAVTSVALSYVATFLVNQGMATGKTDREHKRADEQFADQRPNSVNLSMLKRWYNKEPDSSKRKNGDTIIDLNEFGIPGMAIMLAANDKDMAQKESDKSNGKILNGMTDNATRALSASASTFFDLSMLQTGAKTLEVLATGDANKAKQMFNAMMTTAIAPGAPNLMQDISFAAENTLRSAKTENSLEQLKNEVAMRWGWANMGAWDDNSLPKLGMWGDSIKYSPGDKPWTRLIDVFKTDEINRDKATQIVVNLYDSLKDNEDRTNVIPARVPIVLSYKGDNVRLTEKQRWELEQKTNQARHNALNSLGDDIIEKSKDKRFALEVYKEVEKRYSKIAEAEKVKYLVAHPELVKELRK